jgi:hypothetical protein
MQLRYVKFEVLTSMIIKGSIFWDMAPYNVVDVYQPLEERSVSIFKQQDWALQRYIPEGNIIRLRYLISTEIKLSKFVTNSNIQKNA